MKKTVFSNVASLPLLFIACAIILTTGASAAGPKQFADFPAVETYSGKPSAIDTSTAPEQWSAVRPVILEIIKEDMAKGPNFAGAYQLATVPCGSGCEAIFVIDLRSGRVYASSEAASNGVVFQKDSRLIILKENKIYNMPKIYLVFENGKFRKVE